MASWVLNSKLLELTIPLVAAVIAWFVNERSKRQWEEYQRKEENYKALLKASRGFHSGTTDATSKKAEFLVLIDLCWLYSPDDVIRKGYDFLEATKTGSAATPAEKDKALGSFIVAIRSDLLKRRVSVKTQLTHSDYRFYQAN